MHSPQPPAPRAEASPVSIVSSSRNPGRLGRLGAFCARHPVWVIAAWLLLLAGATLGRQLAAPVYSD